MKKRRITYTYIIAIVILMAVIPVTRRGISEALRIISKPIIFFASSRGIAESKFLNGIFEIKNLKQQNNELNDRLKEYMVDKSEINELKVENEQLKKQIGYTENYQSKNLIPAKIIGRDAATFLDYIIVDKGSDEGIVLNKAAVSEGFLVGKVTEVWANQAKVTLITSKDSLIQAMMQKSRSTGVLKGGIAGVTLENISQDVDFEKEELVVTSGLGGNIEQGILIGAISDQRSGKSDIFKIFSVKSFIDFNRIELIFIVK